MSYRIPVVSTLLALAALTSTASAAEWPTKPMKIIVGLPAGSAPDVAARVLAEKLPKYLGAAVIVDNKPGAGGLNAVRALESSNDEHSIAFTISSLTSLTPNLLKAANYDVLRDFRPIVGLAYTPLHIVAGPTTNIKTLPDLIKAARAAPGNVVFGHPGNTTLGGLAVELLAQQQSLKFNSVQFSSPAQALTALTTGDATVYVDGVSVMLPFSKTGKVNDIALLSPTRTAGLEGMRLGVTDVKDFVVVGRFGLIGPKSMASDRAEKLEKAVLLVLKEKDVIDRLQTLGIYADAQPEAAFRTMLLRENQTWGRVIQQAGMKAQ